MEKLKTNRVLVVEGRYDAAKLASMIDTTIIKLDGFLIYKDKAKQNLLKRLAKENGLLLLTDCDGAGFRLRTFVANFVGEKNVLHAYTPAIQGKERRKAVGGKEGLLGVEGVPTATLYELLTKTLAADCLSENKAENACAETESELIKDSVAHYNDTIRKKILAEKVSAEKKVVTYLDLYHWGLSGTQGSAERKTKFLKSLGLPPRLSKKEMVEVLNRLYSYDELVKKAQLL